MLVHGDGVRSQDKDSLLTVSMSGLLNLEGNLAMAGLGFQCLVPEQVSYIGPIWQKGLRGKLLMMALSFSCCRPCHLCPGNKTAAENWFDFRPTSSWKQKPATTPLPAHPLCKVIGWSRRSYLLDWLHINDLGVASHACANVLFYLVYCKLKHMPRATAVALLLGAEEFL